MANTLEAQRQLLKYHRLNFETGEYWRNNEYRFDVKNRVDTTLMNNLRVMSHIRNIREKIEDNPSKPVYIQTVWGVGYKFNDKLKEADIANCL